MTSVAPPPPPQPPTSGGGAAQTTVSLPPQSSAAQLLAKAALNSFISGEVKPSATQGQLILQTDLGLLQFKAPFNLPKDTQATFRLVQKTPHVQIQLTAVNGKAVSAQNTGTRATGQGAHSPATTSNPATQSQTGKAASTIAPNFAGLNKASGLRAFVLNPPQNQTTLNTAQSPQGAQAPQNTPQSQGSSQGATQSAQNIASSKSTAPSNAQATPRTATSGNFQPGNQLNVRLLSVQLPGQAGQATQLQSPTSSSGAAGGAASTSTVITQGTVQSTTAQGLPIVKFSQGVIALDTTAKIPEGTQIKMEVLSSIKPENQNHINQSTPTKANIAAIGKNWPALDEATKLLAEINPTAADMLNNTMLPKPDNRLAANMIFFLKALGRGSFKNWADDKVVRALSRAKPELLKKLESDFSQISDKAKSPNSTDWKIAYVPLQDNGDIRQIRLAERDHEDEAANSKEDPGVRFVIDLSLSRLGPMQLDGLSKDTHKKFDLIIRTHKALPAPMRRDILAIYNESMDAINFAGRLTFQVTPNFIEIEGVDASTAQLNLGMLV